MSAEKDVKSPRFKPGSVVRVDQGSVHIFSTVRHAKYVEVKKPLTVEKEGAEPQTTIKTIVSEWQYLLEGEPNTRFPESMLTGV